MIIVFGSICMDLCLDVETLPEMNESAISSNYDIAPSGKGANQALSAIRSGAKVALVGKTGDDEFASKILNKLRREGIMTSGVAQGEKPTGTNIIIRDKAGNHQHIKAAGANLEAAAEQIPEEILKEDTLVLLQTEIKPEENASILEKAKESGTTTMMNLSPNIDLTQKALDNIDYLIVNQEEAKQLAGKLGLKAKSNALKMAQGFAKQGDLNCIITIGSRGGVAVTKEGVGWSVEALEIEKVVDRSGAEDAYCGTLAACIHAGIPLPRAMKRASIAGSLTCTKKGTQNAFPFHDSIEGRINDLEDPQQQELE